MADPYVITEGDSGAYDPAHGAEWFNFLRQKGLLDVEREEMGRGARLFTRSTVHQGNVVRKSRLDKFMVPEGRSFKEGWQWSISKCSAHEVPFPSDHSMLRAKLVVPDKKDRGKPRFKLT